MKDMKKSLTARLIMNMLAGVLSPLLLWRVRSCQEVLLLGNFPELHVHTHTRAHAHMCTCTVTSHWATICLAA